MKSTNNIFKKFKTNPSPQLLPDTDREIIWYEQNLFRMPLFFLNKKDVGTRKILEIPIKTPDGEGIWRVSPNVDYGAGGPFDDAVLMAIHKILTRLPKPLTNPIDIGTLSHIEKILHCKESGSNRESIKKTLKRIASLTITSKLSFYDKMHKRFLSGMQGVFHIIDKVILLNEEIDGKKSEGNYIWLNETYLRSINAQYVTPVDIEFYIDLKDTERALFKLLTVRFFANRHKKEPVVFKYSNICKLTTLTRRKSPSSAKQQLDPSHNGLLGKSFLSLFKWENIPGDKKDWYVFYWPGKLAESYFNQYPNLPSLKKDVFILEHEGKGDEDLEEEIKEEAPSLFDNGILAGKSTIQDQEELINAYSNFFEKKFGQKPILGKNEKSIFDELLSQYPKDILNKLLKVFIETEDDDYIRKSGYTVAIFKTCLNKVIIKFKKLEKESAIDYKSAVEPISDEDRIALKDEISNFNSKFKSI